MSFKLWPLILSKQADIIHISLQKLRLRDVNRHAHGTVTSKCLIFKSHDSKPSFLLLHLQWHHVQKFGKALEKISLFCFKFNLAFSCSVWVKVSGNFQVKEDNCKGKQASHRMAKITAHTILVYRIKYTHISELRETVCIAEQPACSRIFGSNILQNIKCSTDI